MTTGRWNRDERNRKPRDFDPSLADEVLFRLETGETLSDICADPDMPLPNVFLRWTQEDPLLHDRYRQSLELHYDVIYPDLISKVHGERDPGRARIYLDSIKHYLQMGHPTKYGQRATLNIPEPKDDKGGGIDYGAEVRRKLETMAERHRQAEKDNDRDVA